MDVSQEELEAIAAHLGVALLDRKLRVATAESCTGGWAAQAMTAIAGSSAWFERGFVTYSNEAKVELLGVSPATLDIHGAVSEATAREMAEGALRNSRADLAAAITGIAGPAGGSVDKPVGLVCFAWAGRFEETRTSRLVFPGDRRAIRAQSVRQALRGLLDRVT